LVLKINQNGEIRQLQKNFSFAFLATMAEGSGKGEEWVRYLIISLDKHAVSTFCNTIRNP
jgi:hypothetical protein